MTLEQMYKNSVYGVGTAEKVIIKEANQEHIPVLSKEEAEAIAAWNKTLNEIKEIGFASLKRSFDLEINDWLDEKESK